MEEKKKITIGSVLGMFGPIFVALFCQMVVSMIGMILLVLIADTKMAVLGITDRAEQEAYLAGVMGADALLAITAIATLATLIIGALWYKKWRPVTELKRKELVNGKLLLALACLGLSLQILISLCLNAVYPVLPQNMTEDYSALIENLIGGNVLLSVVVTVVLAPLAEEFLFRGLTLCKTEKIMPFLAANVVQAVLFAIYHLNLIQGVYAFVLGMVLGYTLKYFNSIWAAVLLHAFVNGSAQLLGLIPDSIGESAFFTPVMAVAGVVLLLVAAKLFPQGRREQAE